MNIHKNTQNGRNFEYYSEEPLISAKMEASAITIAKRHKNRATTIKHFLWNTKKHIDLMLNHLFVSLLLVTNTLI